MKHLKLTILSLLLSFSSFSQIGIEEDTIYTSCSLYPNPAQDVISVLMMLKISLSII
jgi:hypothetical protein